MHLCFILFIYLFEETIANFFVFKVSFGTFAWFITYNKIQCLSLTLPGLTILKRRKVRFILGCYESLILACHDSFTGWTNNRRKTYQFDATCLRRQYRKILREQNAFHKTYVPPISWIVTQQLTANENKQSCVLQ